MRALALSRPAFSEGLVTLGVAAFCGSGMMRVCDSMLPAYLMNFRSPSSPPRKAIRAYAIAYGALQLL